MIASAASAVSAGSHAGPSTCNSQFFASAANARHMTPDKHAAARAASKSVAHAFGRRTFFAQRP